MLNEAPGHLSYSQYSTYLECGWKWYLQKIAQIPEPPAVYLAGGTAVHKASEVIDEWLAKEGL